MIEIENNERLTELREQALQCVDDYSKAVYNNDFKTMNDLDIKLKEIETDYANEIAKEKEVNKNKYAGNDEYIDF